MKKMYNIYVDESCYLEHDGLPVMCIGYTKIESHLYPSIKEKFQKLKLKYHTPTEIKWNKVSVSRIELYKQLLDVFYEQPIEFRCVLIKNKANLDHKKFNRGDHDAFYYKVAYLLLHNSMVNNENDHYRVFFDYKDSWGKMRLKTLAEVFDNKYEGKSPFIYFQQLRSDENELLQLTDLMLGAVAYKARGEHLKENASAVKKEIVSYLENITGYNLSEGTIPWEHKFNIFDFQIRTSDE